MAKRKTAFATITYTGGGLYSYDGGKGSLRYGETVTVSLPLAPHWQVLIDRGEASLS
jgi:hypothetical protein